MPAKRKLTPEQEIELVKMCEKGYGNAEIAKKFGITAATVGKYYRRAMRERDRHEMVAFRDKETYLVWDKRRLTFIGTCDGETREFDLEDKVEATVQFDEWVAELRVPDITPAPVPEISVKRKDDVISEQRARIAELEAIVEQRDHEPVAWRDGEWVSGDVVRNITAERDALKRRVEHAESAVEYVGHVERTGKACLLMATEPEPKPYGLYDDESRALTELDKLNDIAAFLGKDDAFTILEVEWRG